MSRSLALGQNNSGSGLSLRGRTLRISQASGSGGSRNRTQSIDEDASGPSNVPAPARNTRDLHIKVPSNGMPTRDCFVYSILQLADLITLHRHGRIKASQPEREWLQHTCYIAQCVRRHLAALLFAQSRLKWRLWTCYSSLAFLGSYQHYRFRRRSASMH